MDVKEALAAANSAYLDGRLDNLAYKHKTLFGLFRQ